MGDGGHVWWMLVGLAPLLASPLPGCRLGVPGLQGVPLGPLLRLPPGEEMLLAAYAWVMFR